MNGYELMFEELVDNGLSPIDAIAVILYNRFQTQENLEEFFNENMTEEEIDSFNDNILTEGILNKVFGKKEEPKKEEPKSNIKPMTTIASLPKLQYPTPHHSDNHDRNIDYTKEMAPEERKNRDIAATENAHRKARHYEMQSRLHDKRSEYHNQQASIVKGLKTKEVKGKILPHANPNDENYNEHFHKKMAAHHGSLAIEADKLRKLHWARYCDMAKQVKEKHKHEVFGGKNKEPVYDFEHEAP